MNRPGLVSLVVALAVLGAAGAAADPYTVVTYNVGLLEVLGDNFVPIVASRAAAAPAAIAKLATDTGASIIQLEEVWRDSYAKAISAALAPLGYTAVVPDVHSIVGLTSGLLLLVKAPLTVVDWSFEPFKGTTLLDAFARKGVLQATIRDTSSGKQFALVSTHTVAIDTNNGVPKDPAQLRAIMVQVAMIRAALATRTQAGALPGLMLGDFNAGPGYVDDVYKALLGAGGIVEAGAVFAPDQAWVTWDPGNPLVKYGAYPNEPAAKIDQVFLQDGGRLKWTVTGAEAVMKDPVAGLTLEPKGRSPSVPAPLSDHYGFMATVELAE